MLSLCGQLVVMAVIIVVMYLYNAPSRRPILGIYRQRSKFYCLKVGLMLLLQRLRPRKQNDPEETDKRQPLSSHPMAIDAVYFNGTAQNRTILTIGTAQRKNRRVDGFCVLRVPEFSHRILVNPKFPDARLEQTEAEEQDANVYAVEGIKVTPSVPMRSWKLAYNGKMKFNDDNSQLFDVKIDAVWSSKLPAFNYDVDISKLTIARAIANEPWSREYFKQLESVHQTHYEQYGDVRGTVTIDGRDYAINTNSVRDHSFANMRDWKNFHRYVMHFFNLANGDRVTVGVICIPITFSRLVVGFITKANTGVNVPISGCDLQLYQHGEQGVAPKDYAFTFKAAGQSYVVQVKANTEFEFYIGESAESRVVELYSDFTVNGIAGWGIAEWQYRNVSGLPK